jgi:hypothetical protein
MSGTGVLITSLCAGVTVTIISLYQKRKQWVDDFRALYAEFWNDKDTDNHIEGSSIERYSQVA